MTWRILSISQGKLDCLVILIKKKELDNNKFVCKYTNMLVDTSVRRLKGYSRH